MQILDKQNGYSACFSLCCVIRYRFPFEQSQSFIAPKLQSCSFLQTTVSATVAQPGVYLQNSVYAVCLLFMSECKLTAAAIAVGRD